MRALVACFGNPLRGDDGCAVAVAHVLLDRPVPDGVVVLDVGIGGLTMVHELMDPVDVLVVVDALDLGRPPGTVVVMQPDVQDPSGLDVLARRDQLADVHYATPERALVLAAGLGLLPATTLLVGVQVAGPESLGEGLDPAVRRAVGPAAQEVRRVVREAGIDWPD